MRFQSERCAQCNTPGKPDNHIQVGHTHYWLCSQDCLNDALDAYIDKEYSLSRTAQDNAEVKKANKVIVEGEMGDPSRPFLGLFGKSEFERNLQAACEHQQALIGNWNDEQERQKDMAFKKLAERAHHEFIAEKTKEYDKLEAESAKKEELAKVKKAIEESQMAEAEKWKPKPFKI